MNKRKRIFALICAFLTSLPAFAAAVDFAFVDMPRILSESEYSKKARASLETAIADEKAKVEKEQKSIKELQDALKRDQAIMTKAQIDEKQKEIQQRVGAYRQMVGQSQQAMQRKQAKLTQETIAPIQEIVADIAKERALKVVFDRTQSGLLFVDEGLNITDDVIKRLDAAFKAKK